MAGQAPMLTEKLEMVLDIGALFSVTFSFSLYRARGYNFSK